MSGRHADLNPTPVIVLIWSRASNFIERAPRSASGDSRSPNVRLRHFLTFVHGYAPPSGANNVGFLEAYRITWVYRRTGKWLPSLRRAMILMLLRLVQAAPPDLFGTGEALADA